jgi:hypothetical protein
MSTNYHKLSNALKELVPGSTPKDWQVGGSGKNHPHNIKLGQTRCLCGREITQKMPITHTASQVEVFVGCVCISRFSKSAAHLAVPAGCFQGYQKRLKRLQEKSPKVHEPGSMLRPPRGERSTVCGRCLYTVNHCKCADLIFVKCPTCYQPVLNERSKTAEKLLGKTEYDPQVHESKCKGEYLPKIREMLAREKEYLVSLEEYQIDRVLAPGKMTPEEREKIRKEAEKVRQAREIASEISEMRCLARRKIQSGKNAGLCYSDIKEKKPSLHRWMLEKECYKYVEFIELRRKYPDVPLKI